MGKIIKEDERNGILNIFKRKYPKKKRKRRRNQSINKILFNCNRA